MRSNALVPMSVFLSATLIATGASSQTAENGGRKLQTSLTGAAGVPSPGDTDGTGTATVIVNSGQRRICYELTVQNIDAATAAHIHQGGLTVAGPVRVTLSAPSDGDSSGCVDVSRERALDILKNPANYYVNIHNPAFPAGALRGQLAK